VPSDPRLMIIHERHAVCVVPLMHSSWNQIIEELEEFLKLKDLVGVQGFKGILLRIMTRACCVFKI